MSLTRGIVDVSERPLRVLPGRDIELASLSAMLEEGGPDVIHVHGIGGVGKSSLVARFADVARDLGWRAIEVDSRRVAPTPIGFLDALGNELGLAPSDVEADLESAIRAVVVSDPHLLVVIDHCEVLPLLDAWMRERLACSVLPGARLVLAGRQPLHASWRSLALSGIEVRSIELDCLDEATAAEVLRRAGVDEPHVPQLVQLTNGHPLALWIAADAVARRPDRVVGAAAAAGLAGELAAGYLDGLDEPTRQGVEALGVLRRGTTSLLGALLPDRAPGDLIARLERLPFVERRRDGLALHDAVRTAITARLEADDPVRNAELRRRAWRQIRRELREDLTPDTWRYTADLLFLIENPILREGFFPSGAPAISVRTAADGDRSWVEEVIDAETGAESPILRRWIDLCPEAWKVAVDVEGELAGCASVLSATDVPASLRRADPVTAAFEADRLSDAVPRNHTVLYLRSWSTPGLGQLPSPAQAALWLDCKRTYLDYRHTMRRLYTYVDDVDLFAPVLAPLGFEVIGEVDGHHILRVDFGPGSVNSWLSGIASRELGLEPPVQVDHDSRSVVLDDDEVALTPLEFGVLDELDRAGGRPVSRADLINRVWGHDYDGGSNVVDAVVRTLRRKLGHYATDVETVRGVGYRFRQA